MADEHPLIDSRVVARYRSNYSLSEDIGADHVRAHYELETQLTRKLLDSTSETRWNTFSTAYTELYQSLPWLNAVSEDDRRKRDYSHWLKLIPQKSRIYEIGSGQARLLRYLSSQGHECVATEITKERGEKHAQDLSGVAWHVSDGINLAEFEPPDSYDVVISTQVIEHLHPDDIETHFHNVRAILKPGGRYIFDTPHRGAGPFDLSLVFGFDRAMFMHLKEYDFPTLVNILKMAGFKDIQAVLYRSLNGFKIGPFYGRVFRTYCETMDRLFTSADLPPRLEQKIRRVLRYALLPTNIWLTGRK
jgi:SAM-dependent methyltransferase